MAENKKRTFGCFKSTLTGSEKKFTTPENVKIFNTYDLRATLDPIRDQGNVSKCVSVSLTDMVRYKMNLGIYKKADFPDDIFYVTRPNEGEGMYPVDAFNYMVNTGVGGQKGELFAFIDNVNDAKYSIIANGPLMACLWVKSYNDDFWNGNEDIGGHAVLFVGYNKDGFILRNSWGEEFGDKGYTTFPYNKFAKCGMEFWTLLI